MYSIVALHITDALAEWLRRVPAKYMGFPRESSNLSGVDYFYKFDIESLFFCAFVHIYKFDIESLFSFAGKKMYCLLEKFSQTSCDI